MFVTGRPFFVRLALSDVEPCGLAGATIRYPRVGCILAAWIAGAVPTARHPADAATVNSRPSGTAVRTAGSGTTERVNGIVSLAGRFVVAASDRFSDCGTGRSDSFTLKRERGRCK